MWQFLDEFRHVLLCQEFILFTDTWTWVCEIGNRGSTILAFPGNAKPKWNMYNMRNCWCFSFEEINEELRICQGANKKTDYLELIYF